MNNIDLKKLWKEVLESIRVTVSPAIFSTWFIHTSLTKVEKNNNRYFIEVGCKSNFIKATIENRYFGLVQDSLSKSLESACDLIFIVKEDVKTDSDTPVPLFDQKPTLTNIEEILKIQNKAGIRPSFSFENFAVSSSNQMAWAAADAVSKSPGSAYNPLFIWGGVGVGKTHLMNAVGDFLIKNDPEVNILSCTGEQFTNDIIEGIRNKNTPQVRNKYRKLNALFVDDIQFIAGKDTVQEEFFHTFNALVSLGSQIILTSDRPPPEISKLEERLRSRFEAGLIVDIAPPDFELRCAIIQIKSKQKNIKLDSDYVHLIAGNVNSARKIEGILTKIISETNLNNTPISQHLIEKILNKGEPENSQTIKRSPLEVVDAACKYFSIGKRAMLGKTRARKIARPRQILMYILRTQMQIPLEEVGRIIGGRDHTTVMHAVDTITHLASTDVNIREDIRGIKKGL